MAINHYKSIFNNPLIEGDNINFNYTSYIVNNKLICYENDNLYIEDIITSNKIIKNIPFEHNHIKQIIATDDLKYIFILYSKFKNIYSKYIIRINDDNLEYFEFENEISNMHIFNNNIVLLFSNGKNIKLINYDGHIIDNYDDNIFPINISCSKNYIIVTNMVDLIMHTNNLIIMKVINNKFVKFTEFINKSCGLFSDDEKTFYAYDNNKESLHIYNSDWNLINIVSIKLNEGTFWYKNYHFNNICLMPDNKHMIFSNYKQSKLWDLNTGKYIGSFAKTNSVYHISKDNLYLIGLDDNHYYVWDINYSKYVYYKTKIHLPEELWKMIENYVIFI